MKISILLLTTTLSFSVLAINPLDETGLQIAEIGEDIIETPVISLHSTGVSAAIISSLFTNARALYRIQYFLYYSYDKYIFSQKSYK